MSRTERHAAAEARRRARARQRSQPPPAHVMRLGRHAERRGQQASTAHVQSAYPAVAEAGLGARGIYIGRDQHGGSFVYDPWVLSTAGLLPDPNVIWTGHPAWAKSRRP